MLRISLRLAKISAVVHNKAIHNTFYSLKKVKIDLSYCYYLLKRQWLNRAIQDTFFKSQKR